MYFKGGLSPTFGFALHRALQGGAGDKIFILQVRITGLRALRDLRKNEVIQLASGGARKTRDTWTSC